MGSLYDFFHHPTKRQRRIVRTLGDLALILSVVLAVLALVLEKLGL